MRFLDVVLFDEGVLMSGEKAWAECKAGQNGSAYGLAVFAYAERWADLMEVAIAERGFENLGDSARETSDMADKAMGESGGITGYMYGKAVLALSRMWVYGCVLQHWHNAKYGEDGKRANKAGGVINPAILSIPVAQ